MYWRLVWQRAWDEMSRRVGGLPAFPLWLVLFLASLLPWALTRSATKPFITMDPQTGAQLAAPAILMLVFLWVLVSTPTRIHAEQETQIATLEARTEHRGLSLDIDCDEIVIASLWSVLGATGQLPAGTYIIARGCHVTNRSTEMPVVLVVKLALKMPDRERICEPMALPQFPQYSMILPNGLQPLLAEEESLPNPLNLEPTNGEAGRIAFRISWNVTTEEMYFLSRQCEMEWLVYDSLSDTRVRLPINRTRGLWRVLER